MSKTVKVILFYFQSVHIVIIVKEEKTFLNRIDKIVNILKL